MTEPKSKYQLDLEDVRWLTKRQSILARDMYLCTGCHKAEVLEVHHIYYVKGNHAWDYPNKALITLCRRCHQKWHDTYKLEIRDKVWCKNEDYVAPKRKGKAKKARVVVQPKKKKNKGLKIPRGKLAHARKLYK